MQFSFVSFYWGYSTFYCAVTLFAFTLSKHINGYKWQNVLERFPAIIGKFIAEEFQMRDMSVAKQGINRLEKASDIFPYVF